MSLDRWIGMAAIAAGLGVILVSIGTVQIPRTIEPGNPLAGDGEPRYDFETKIGLEGTINGVTFAEETFRCEAEPSGLTSFSIADNTGQFSFLGAQNVEVHITVTGEQLDGPIRDKFVPGNEFLGTDGEVGATDSFVVPFETAKLPAGEYTVTYEAFWTDNLLPSGGNTESTETVRIPEGCR